MVIVPTSMLLDTRTSRIIGEELKQGEASLGRVCLDAGVKVVYIALVVFVMVQVHLLGCQNWGEEVVRVWQVGKTEGRYLILSHMLLLDTAVQQTETQCDEAAEQQSCPHIFYYFHSPTIQPFA